ncbi:MAG TPA: oligosaccharide flippase family protein [Terracidiphilus sp.]|nr:oligosaccharide flippase family protein [Terracidiphilus sp.]
MRRDTARSIAWNYAGHLYQIAINLALTSYIVRHVSVPEYGLYLLILSLSITLYLLDMGFSNLLVQAYVAVADEPDKDSFNQLLSTSFLTLTALGTVGVLIFYAISKRLPGPFNIPSLYLHEASTIFVLAAVVILFGFCSMAVEQAFRASHRFDRLNQIQLIVSSLQAVASVAVLAGGYRIVALASIQVGVAFLQFVLLVAVLPSSVPGARLSLFRFRFHAIRPFLHLSKWAFLNNLSGYVFDLLAWVILGSMGTMQDAAMFGLASKAPKQLWNLVDKGASVALPMLSESSHDEDIRRLQRTYTQTQVLVFGAILPFIVLGILFARPLIQLWAGEQYTNASPVMQWLLLAAFSHALGYASDQLLYACGEVKKAATMAFWGGALSVVFALLLVPRYGAAGLAAGMAVTQLFVNCVWFTRAACDISRTSPLTLVKAILNGLIWPAVVLVAEIGLIWGISLFLSTAWVLASAVLGGAVYLAVWAFSTAMPIYRRPLPAEIAD